MSAYDDLIAEAQSNISIGGIRTDTSYEDALADLSREQWEDYKTRYLPVQDELLALSQNDQLLTEQLARNETNIANSFKTAEQNESMRMGRYGLSSMGTQTERKATINCLKT